MSMIQFDRILLGRQAKELGFVRDTFEKVCRLADVLAFVETDPLLSEVLALKGGTAINLTIFDLPRLSVDIDLDYSKDTSRGGMLQDRDLIRNRFLKRMAASGYSLSPKTKQYYALDSFVFEYVNAGGVKDNLKIEINYLLRCHVFPTSRRAVNLPWRIGDLTVLCVDPMEIFAAKSVALMSRSAARDLYDVFNLQKSELFDGRQIESFRECIVFYAAIGSEVVPKHFDFSGIERITEQKIKTDLTPVLRRSERFDLTTARKQTEDYLKGILLPERELSFWIAFAKGEYKPELLFNDPDTLSRIAGHPMALWKCSRIKGERQEMP